MSRDPQPPQTCHGTAALHGSIFRNVVHAALRRCNERELRKMIPRPRSYFDDEHEDDFQAKLGDRDARPLRFRFLSALIAGANLSQIGIRVNPGGMIVVEVELDGIVAHWRGAGDFDDVLAMNRKRVGRNFHRRGRVTACGAGTTLAQIGVRISGFVPVTPFDKHATWCRQLDVSRGNVHRASKLEG